MTMHEGKMQEPSSLAGDPVDTDYTAVGCAITTISSNLTEMSKGVKLLAALMDDEVGSGEDLLKAARTLAGAVSDLLKAVEPTSGEVRPHYGPTTGKWIGLFFSHVQPPNQRDMTEVLSCSVVPDLRGQQACQHLETLLVGSTSPESPRQLS